MVPQFLEIPTPFSKIEYSSHSLAYEITQPIKSNHPHSQGRCHFPRRPQAVGLLLPPSETVHTLSMECVSL